MLEPIAVPQEVIGAHEGWVPEVAWNEYPGTTVWRLVSPLGDTRFLKIADFDRYPTLRDEIERTVWATRCLPVPNVVSFGRTDAHDWMVTDAMPGRDATDDALRADPASLVPALARGLRRFHDAPIDDCPFDFRLDAALEHCRRRVEGEGVPKSKGDFHAEYVHLSPARALGQLHATRPATEDLVLCHGDYCFPNMLIEDGEVTGYLDLGELGVADRWWDLAIATWSCDWNVSPGWQDTFLEAYGVTRNDERIAYYRLLYDLAS